MIVCYDGTYIWFYDKPDIKVLARYAYEKCTNDTFVVTNVNELIKKINAT